MTALLWWCRTRCSRTTDRRWSALVNTKRLPALYPEREYADAGGLISYGASRASGSARAGWSKPRGREQAARPLSVYASELLSTVMVKKGTTAQAMPKTANAMTGS
jgi:hypothetical protein